MLESTKIPKEWTEVLNTYFDLVAVPDPFLEEVFYASGVKIPVFTLPLGLDLKLFLDQPLKTAYNRLFTFGCLGSLGDRKNQMKLAIAFDRAFQKDPNVQLLIHARSGDTEYRAAFLQLLDTLQNPMIKFQEQPLTNSSYLELFKSLDMLVNVSKGEGFSIQPREAMALGIPCLISNNTAQSSIVQKAYTLSLQTPYKMPCYYSYLKQFSGNNFDFDVPELVKLLQLAYEEKETHLKHSLANKQYAKAFDYSEIKGLYRTLICPKKVILGTKNSLSLEGLETTSEELVEKYKRLLGSS